MGLNEISIGIIYISPFLFYTLLAFPICYLLNKVLHKLGLYRYIWHEMLFLITLYIMVFFLVTTIGSFFN